MSEENCLEDAADYVLGTVSGSAALVENEVLQHFACQNSVTKEEQIIPRGNSIVQV